jgi:hypothetical protein
MYSEGTGICYILISRK